MSYRYFISNSVSEPVEPQHFAGAEIFDPDAAHKSFDKITSIFQSQF
jgi:hypothetical protein